MTMFVHSPDGTTPGATRSSLPDRFTRTTDGAWSIPTAETAEAFGWYEVTETARPDADPWDTVTVDVVHDGDRFVQRWTVAKGVEPLVDPAERPDEDTIAASIALLTEDSVGYRALLTLIVQALNIPPQHVAAAQAAATQRLVALADNPALRRQMMAERIDRAEAARGR
jgi:hypothetical protein